MGVAVSVSASILAQTPLSLQECLRLTVEQNLTLRQQQNESRMAKLGIKENRAMLLPQINGVAGWNDNFEPPVSATDQSAAGGKDYWITHTLQYSANFGIQLSMPLYNQTLLTSQTLVKQVAGVSELQEQKAREDLIVNTTKMYYLAQVTTEQIELLEDNIGKLRTLKEHTAAFVENGMVLEVDLQRVDLNLQNLQTACENARLVLAQQLNSLKYVMNYPAGEDICVVRDSNNEHRAANVQGFSESIPEIRLLEESKSIAETRLKMLRQGYLPSLALTGFAQGSMWTSDMSRWFKSGYDDNKIWGAYGIGVSLKIPIFDGLDKHYKTQKGRLAIDNAAMKLEDSRRALQTQYANATIERENAYRTRQQQLDNYRLAQDVYRVTSDQFAEGVTTMTAVLQDQLAINQAMSAYVNAQLNYKLADLTILKLSGQIETLLK